MSTKFFEDRGLDINPAKCESLILKTLLSEKKTFAIITPLFYVKAKPIKPIDVGEAFNYLGQRFTYMGVTKCSTQVLSEQLQRMKKAALKQSVLPWKNN